MCGVFWESHLLKEENNMEPGQKRSLIVIENELIYFKTEHLGVSNFKTVIFVLILVLIANLRKKCKEMQHSWGVGKIGQMTLQLGKHVKVKKINKSSNTTGMDKEFLHLIKGQYICSAPSMGRYSNLTQFKCQLEKLHSL